MGYYCRTCNEASEHWHNHGDGMLAEFFRASHAVNTLDPIWVIVRTVDGWADSQMSIFLAEHDGHDIALQSEYGDVRDMPAVAPGAT